MIVHQRLKELRERRKLKREIAAYGLGMSVRRLEAYETNRVPTGRTLTTMADFYGVGVEYFSGSLDPSPEEIAAACAEIRKGWTPECYVARAKGLKLHRGGIDHGVKLMRYSMDEARAVFTAMEAEEL